MRSQNSERVVGVEGENFGMVQLPRGPDQPFAEVRMRVLQRQVVRRPGGAERIRRAGRAEQRAQQSFHSDQSDGVRDARGKGIRSGCRKRKR